MSSVYGQVGAFRNKFILITSKYRIFKVLYYSSISDNSHSCCLNKIFQHRNQMVLSSSFVGFKFCIIKLHLSVVFNDNRLKKKMNSLNICNQNIFFFYSYKNSDCYLLKLNMNKSIKPIGLAEIMPITYNDNTEKQTKTRQQSSIRVTDLAMKAVK